MRGPSRAALAEARHRLSEAVTSAAVARTLGEELFAILGVLDEQAALRRALSDGSRPTRARAELARTLFGGQVSEATLGLFTSMCESRWSSPADLASAVEEIAVTAFAAAAERARHLDDLEDQLFRFGRVVMSSPELRTVLSNLTIPAQYKRQLLDTLLEGKVTADSRALIGEAAEHLRGRSMDMTLDHYAQWAAQWRERLIAVARVAIPLTDRQRERLIAALEGVYGHEVHLDVILDPRVEGGISVQIGDEFIDGSVASRLGALRRRLAA
jgi:F-type H+-transporting ATPase subunit delta